MIANDLQDPHAQAQLLLPWYVTDRLSPAERAQVEAHLACCAECRDELATERALTRRVRTEEPPAMDAGAGWAALQARLAPPAPRRSPVRRWTRLARMTTRPRVLGGVIAAQAVLCLVLGGALIAGREDGAYHVLGGAPMTRAGNALVMFEPQLREADLRRALQANHARVVDGPTAAGAYVVMLPEQTADTDLRRLRTVPGVTLAEPIDGSAGE